jgi:formylglycine-generating enzyme required for sulfatase activity
MPADVFISYNREDREIAKHVASALEAEGFSVWWDAALRAGETYDEVTEQNLRNAGAVVVLWSKRSANSKWVRAEATVGERSSTLVPALIEDCDRPVRFELVQTADLRHWRGERQDPHWRAFVQDVKTAISRRNAKAAPAPVQATGDVTIETTFWNSVKDGSDPSDFEAYLARYPNGHFAALAKNRLVALKGRAQAAAPPPHRPAAPVQQAQPAARPPQQRPVQAAQQTAPKKSANGLIFGGIAAAIAVIGVVAFMLVKGGSTSPAEESVAVASEAASAATEPAPIEPAPADHAAVVDKSAPETPAASVEPTPAQPETAQPEPVAAAPADDPTFRDCETCPLMKKLPGGAFKFGSPEDEPNRNSWEGPQRDVTVRPFAIGVHEVTLKEWTACVEAGACAAKGASADPNLPVLGLSWRDASGYATWLSKETGRVYRLPTEAEWEYAARGGAATAYWWGAIYDREKVATGSAAPVGSHPANGFGLFDVTGNAREWVEDCYVNNFLKTPDDGSANRAGDCSLRVIRGGDWMRSPADLRIASRGRVNTTDQPRYMGVRLAAEVK